MDRNMDTKNDMRTMDLMLSKALTKAGINAPSKNTPASASKRLAAQLWEIGVLPHDLNDGQLRKIGSLLYDMLEELGIEPLVYNSHVVHSEKLESPQVMNITFHDDVETVWCRRSLAAFLNQQSENKLPKRAVQIIRTLQNAGLPLSASLEVIVPTADDAADPILMLSFCDKFIFLLCRWSNNVG